MTERGITAIARSPQNITIGPSSLAYDNADVLIVTVDEWTVPVPRRLSGKIRIDLGAMFDECHSLDDHGRHHWRPIAPCAHATVQFDRPGLAWQGKAYVDMNTGSEPLETGFRGWTWSRETASGSTRILYDLEQRDGAQRGIAVEYRPDGSMQHFAPDPPQRLSRTGWLVPRATRAAPDRQARVLRTLEDTPFYSRSVLGLQREGVLANAVHESVDLDRFASRWVQMLLPFKMPRRP